MEPIEKVLQLFPQSKEFLREYLINDLYGSLMINQYRVSVGYEKLCVYIYGEVVFASLLQLLA